MNKQTLALMAAGCGLLLPGIHIEAAELCATNSTELQQHLAAAGTNGEETTIRIAAGDYPAPSSGFHFIGHDGQDLTLVGGYSEIFSNPCGQVLDDTPYTTSLDGEGGEPIITLRFVDGSAGDILIRRLTFRNGATSTNSAAGIDIGPTQVGQSYEGVITIEKNAFLHNQGGEHNAALRVGQFTTAFNGNSSVRIINNLFFANESGTCPAARIIMTDGNTDSGIYVTNNTIVNNTTNDDLGAFCANLGVGRLFIANNNMSSNDVADLAVFIDEGATEVTYSLFNNNIGIREGSEPTNDEGNLNIEPAYEPCTLGLLQCVAQPPRFVPLPDSPLVDAGRHPRGLEPGWFLTNSDLIDQPRIDAVGERVDIGAFESHARMFVDRFEGP